MDLRKLDNGIFCGVGILSGTCDKRVKKGSELRLVAGPVIYGQVTFDDSLLLSDSSEPVGSSLGEQLPFVAPPKISEWVINHDLASSLIPRIESEDDEVFAAFSSEEEKSANKLIGEIERKIELFADLSLDQVRDFSNQLMRGYIDITGIQSQELDTPLDSVKEAITARDFLEEKHLFYVPGDWIYFGPIPPGLSTYYALDDLASEGM